MIAQTINWHAIPEDGMPDDESNVLIAVRNGSAYQYTGEGCRDCETWLRIGGEEVVGLVTHWAELPNHPEGK